MLISFLSSFMIARRLVLSVFLASLGALAFASAPALAAGGPVVAEQFSSYVRSFSVELHVAMEGEIGESAECHFQYGSKSVSENEVPCQPEIVHIQPPDHASTVGAAVTGLSPSTTYHYRAILKNSSGTAEGTPKEFTTPPASETPIDLKAEPTPTGVRLEGVLNPKAVGIPGGYEFLYKQSASDCTEGKTVSGPATGAKEEAVTSEVTGLAPKAVYTFCLRATNDQGGESILSLPVTVTTLVIPPAISEESFSGVTLHRAELHARLNSGNGVSTAYYFEYGTTTAYGAKTAPAGGESEFTASAVAEGLEPSTEYHFRVVATNIAGTSYGPDTTFTTQAAITGLPDGRGYELVSPLANADGNVYRPEIGDEALSGQGNTYGVVDASADGDAVKYVADPLASGGNGKGNTYVATHDTGGGWSLADLSTPGFDGASFEALFSNELSNSGTSAVPAGSHVLSAINGIGYTGGAEDLIDSVGGRLVAVSVLPEGLVVSDAAFGSVSNGENDLSHVVSADGSYIYWTDLEEGPDKEHLFVREDDERTVPVSVGAAGFWTASTDGRYVFYTEGEKLWRFDVEGEVREEIEGTGAGVLGVVGVNETGEDGAYVYFVAQSVLAPGATPGNCVLGASVQNGGKGGCNLYVRHAGVTSFIASLTGRDVKQRGFYHGPRGVLVGSLGGHTAEVTPDGHSLVFLSDASLTGYDNNGDEEAFVYDAGSGRLSCVSCNPTGVAATPVPARLSGTGVFSLLPLSYNSTFMFHWMSDDGSRVFFETPEALVAQDANGETDVYEWEREGSGECQVKAPARKDGGCIYLLSGGTSPDRSFLVDASASGDDVFIVTRANLVPQDRGETLELYDARVGAVQPVEEPACTGTGCQGLPAAPPPFATPSSVTFNGVGNFSPSVAPTPVTPKAKAKPVKCKKGFVKKRGKCVKSPKAKKSIHHQGSK